MFTTWFGAVLGAATRVPSTAGVGINWESCWIKVVFMGVVMIGCCLGGSMAGSTVMSSSCVVSVAMVMNCSGSSLTVAK